MLPNTLLADSFVRLHDSETKSVYAIVPAVSPESATNVTISQQRTKQGSLRSLIDLTALIPATASAKAGRNRAYLVLECAPTANPAAVEDLATTLMSLVNSDISEEEGAPTVLQAVARGEV